MEDRRTFLKATIGALGAAAPLSAKARVQGANNRVRLGVIGGGNRSRRVLDAFARNTDVQWLADCDVTPPTIRRSTSAGRNMFGLQSVTDYRRILDRKDIDAVLVFSHARITIDAISAGKDVYVEQTAANTTVERLNAMLDASRASKQVIQIGTEQRSGDHFAEAKKVIDSGVLGNVRHVAIVQPGPGLVGDLARHHVDVAHWFMNADDKVPRKTAAVGLFVDTRKPDPKQVPDAFLISWQYDNFVMTFANGEMPRPQDDLDGCGTFFIGGNGYLQVNRMGYALRPPMPRTVRTAGAVSPPTHGNVNPRPGHRGPRVPVERNVYLNPRGGEEGYPLDAHVRNFLDCIKSRRKPNADMEVGYHSALPCLLALEAMQRNEVVGWDAAARRSTLL